MNRNIADSRKLSDATGRRASRWLMSIALLVVAGLAFVPVLRAVHDDGFFELDRNAVNDPATPGDDWDDVYNHTTSASASATSFDADAPGTTIFTTGGSKDDLDTTNWRHTGGSVPDKDELTNAYAARYDGNLYFGADRFAQNGDSQMGFWFFQENVGICTAANTATCGPVGTFGPGKHKNGDVLVLSNFTNGGGAVNIRVFQWHSPGGAINGTLDLVAGTTTQTADCVGPPSVPAGDNFCATVNTGNTNSPWPYTPKSGSAGIFPAGAFYEGGIDLAFLGLANECFASFLAETRSSQSTDATLKDFVGGSFQACTSGVTTTPSSTNSGSGTPIPASGISIGVGGSVTVYDGAVLTINGASTWSGSLTFHLCGPTPLSDADYTLCTTGGTLIGNTISVNQSDPQPIFSAGANITAVGRYCWRADFDGTAPIPDSSDSSVGECFKVIPVPSSVGTAQDWLPNDTASVLLSDGVTKGTGSVTFTLYQNATCSGTGVDFGPYPLVNGEARTNNTSIITTSSSVSWRVTFAPSSANVSGSTGRCEISSVSIDNAGIP